MIIEHNVIGSKETSFHDFEIGVNDKENSVTVSGGSYWRNGTEIFRIDSESTFSIPTTDGDIQEVFTKCVYITRNGIIMAQGVVQDLIDRLVWFTLSDDFTAVNVDCLKIIEE